MAGLTSKIKSIEWVHEGFEEILCSSGTMQMVQNITNQIAGRANANNTRGGSGFSQKTEIQYAFGQSKRWLGVVSSTDEASKIAEKEDKALSRAVM